MTRPYRLTPRRLEWLRQLHREGRAARARSRVGFDCMQAGWTEWNYVDGERNNMTTDQARERYGERWWDHVRIRGERLTEAGRQLLLDNEDE